MIKRIFSLTLSLVIFLSFSGISFAQYKEAASDTTQKIIEYKLSGSDNIQQFIDTTLSANAGVNAEWYVVTLSQTGSYNFDSYENALLNYLENNRVSSASSRLKYMMALLATGSDSGYVKDNFDTSIGQQGIMSWVFGLHILNNGFESSEYSQDNVCQRIISLQLSDGGFAVSGDRGNPDVTAMTITALAPYYENNTDVKACIDKALSFLSDDQNEYGGYESYGVYCSESTAQVLMALSSLGIDCTQDERFIKNGITVLDSLCDFMLEDGSFSHELGASSNENATSQAYYCLNAYLKMLDGDNYLFVFEDNSIDDTTTNTDSKVDNSSKVDEIAATDDEISKSNVNLKLAVIIGIVILVVFFFVVLFISKKKNVRNFLGVACIGAILIVVVLKLDIKTTDEFYDVSSKQNVIGTVTLEIINPSSKENGGVILPKTEYGISKDQTAYDILVEACAENKIHLETNGIDEYAYVEGINHIYEFDKGELSGWMYYVNKESPSVSCGSFVLSDNDAISFIYSTQMGSDIVLE